MLGRRRGPVHFIRDEYVLTQRVDQRQGALVVLFHAASGSLQRVDQREVVVESEKP